MANDKQMTAGHSVKTEKKGMMNGFPPTKDQSQFFSEFMSPDDDERGYFGPKCGIC